MRITSIGILLLILLIGAFFRFFGLNWDQGFHLHPDERFLTMVGTAGKMPSDFLTYLNPGLSSFNPANNNFPFFVYGIFPVTIVKLFAIVFKSDTYDAFVLLGRTITAILDLVTIVLVFLSAKILTKKFHSAPAASYFSALLYAIAVFSIQMAHFFTVDIFLNFFLFLSFYLMLLYEERKTYLWIVLSACFLGIALACKLSALAMLPLLLILIIFQYKKGFMTVGIALSLFLLTAYVSLRIADPYLFASSNFFNAVLNPQFMTSITTLNSYNNPSVWYPPGVQWIHKTPGIFSVINLFFFGIGPVFFILSCLGIGIFLRTKRRTLLSLTLWAIALFFYQSIQYVKTMRYFIFLYPFFAIFAGTGYAFLAKKLNTYVLVIFGLGLFLWPLLFISIYTKPHTRVDASYWIQKNIPAGSTILTEYWDDPLPLRVVCVAEKHYRIIELSVFDMDTDEKWKKIQQSLALGDYLILSSNRGWGSIPTAPERYPRMTKFYQDLFAGNLPYKKIATFTSYPSLAYMGIPLTISDDLAEEAFTVFDHPKVLIFKKEVPQMKR